MHADDWKKYWQADDTRLIHFIGKDNIVFHCIIFPVILHATGEYIVPDNVPANEFMNLQGDKMSTSRGWSVEMHEYLEDFPGKEDVLRYALLTNLPETKDSEFTWQDYQIKNNSELVGIFGNFVNRALVLTQKHFDNKVPAKGALNDNDLQVIKELTDCKKLVADALNAYRFREATQYMMNLARVGNKYLAETEPWKLVKTDLPRVGTILNIAIQVAANLSVIAEPFLPFTSTKLRTMLGIGELTWKDAGADDLVLAGSTLNEPKLLFEKIEDDVIATQIQKLEDKKNSATAAAEPVEPLKPSIAIDDFGKLDIRIGTVVAAEKMPKSDKLLKLTVNSGLDKRTILSGIAKHYAPEDLIGKQVTFIANLAPRKMMGIESNGMILMAEDKDGKLRLIRPIDEVAPGSKVS